METNIRKRTFQAREDEHSNINKSVYKTASISNLINHDPESESQVLIKHDNSDQNNAVIPSVSRSASSSSTPSLIDHQEAEQKITNSNQDSNVSIDTIETETVTNEDDTLLAAAVLGNLKNSSSSSTINTMSTSVDLPASNVNSCEPSEKNGSNTNSNNSAAAFIPNSSISMRSAYNYNNVQSRFFDKVSTYYQSSKEYSPTFKVGAEYVEKKAMPLVRRFEQQRKKSTLIGSQNIRKSTSGSNNNSSVVGTMNLNYLLNKQQQNKLLSVQLESKKNLRVLLKILKLANSRLSDKVDNLQHMITLREEALNKKYENDTENEEEIDDDDDEFHDASSELNQVKRRKRNPSVSSINSNSSTNSATNKQKAYRNGSDNNSNGGLYQIKKDIVITVKKAVDIVSRFTGSSLPEPARSNVREVLLKLPVNLSKALHTELTPINSVPGSPIHQNNENNNMLMGTPPASSQALDFSVNSPKNITGFVNFDANRKILILAKESLDSFANIIKIFDSNLEKVENWVVDDNGNNGNSSIAKSITNTDSKNINSNQDMTQRTP